MKPGSNNEACQEVVPFVFNGVTYYPMAGDADGNVIVALLADSTMIVKQIDETQLKVTAYIESVISDFPVSHLHFHQHSTVLAGNALIPNIATDQIHNVFWLANGAANGDSFSFRFSIAGGTYDILITGTSLVNAGKIDWYLDDVIIATAQDWYTSPAVRNVNKTIADVVIATNGIHTLKGVVNGKNAASGGYYLPLTNIFIS